MIFCVDILFLGLQVECNNNNGHNVGKFVIKLPEDSLAE